MAKKLPPLGSGGAGQAAKAIKKRKATQKEIMAAAMAGMSVAQWRKKQAAKKK